MNQELSNRDVERIAASMLKQIENKDTGYVARSAINGNFHLLGKAVDNKVDREEMADYGYGIKRYKDPVNTVADLPKNDNQEGDGRVVSDDLDPTGKYAYVHLWDGTKWGKTPLIILASDVAISGGSHKTLQQVDEENTTFNKTHLSEYNTESYVRKLFYTYNYYGFQTSTNRVSNEINIPNNSDIYTLSFVSSLREGDVFGKRYTPLFCLAKPDVNVVQLYVGFDNLKALNVINPSGFIKPTYNKKTVFESNTQYSFNIQIGDNQIDIYANGILEMTLEGSRTREILAVSTHIYLANYQIPVTPSHSVSDISIGYVVLSLGANLFAFTNRLYLTDTSSISGLSLPLLTGYKRHSLLYNHIDYQLSMSISIDDGFLTNGNDGNYDADILFMGIRIRVGKTGIFYVKANNIDYISDVLVTDRSKHDIVIRLFKTSTQVFVNNILVVDLPINCKYYVNDIVIGKFSETNYVAKFRIDSFIVSENFNPIYSSMSTSGTLQSDVLSYGTLENTGFARRIGAFGLPQYATEPLKRLYPFGASSYFKDVVNRVSYTTFNKQLIGIKGKQQVIFKGGSNNELGVTKPGIVKTINVENGSSIKMDYQGYKRSGEYIHPAIAFHPTGIAGYKYWMFVSNYPAELPQYEDDDVLVSNDGYNWYRIMPKSQESDANKPTLPPNVFALNADFGRENSFVPIPPANMEFKVNGITRSFARTLKHDPEILIDGNEVFLYNFYNFFEDVASTIYHRFVVVISTINGKDWFINRADGSKIEATEANLKELFTQSSIDGKNNYIRYFNNSTIGNDLHKDTAMQIVKVSDNEWYAYYGEYYQYTNSNMGLKRYKGTSHLNFDWSTWEYCQTNRYSDKTIHLDVQYIDNKFYVLGRGYIYESNDGINFTEQAHTPYIMYCADGYKVDMVIGEGGKMLVVCGALLTGNIAGQYTSNKTHSPSAVWTFVQEFKDFFTFIDYAKNGRGDTSIGALVSCYKENNQGWYRWIPIEGINTANEFATTTLIDDEFEETDNVSISILCAAYHGNKQWVEIATNLLIPQSLKVKYIQNGSSGESGNKNEIRPSLFKVNRVYALVGRKYVIHKDNLLNMFNSSGYFIDIDTSDESGRDYNDYWEYTPTVAKTITLTARLYSDRRELLDTHSFPVISVSAQAWLTPRKLMMIGNSFTWNNIIPDELHRILTSADNESTTPFMVFPSGLNLGNLTMIGSQIRKDKDYTGLQYHEGYSGWELKNFLVSNTGDVVNPFWHNGKLDFKAYFTNNGYDVPDTITIGMAWNDITKNEYDFQEPSSIVDRAKILLDAIFKDYPDMKVVWWCESFPGRRGQGKFGWGSSSRTDVQLWKLKLKYLYEAYIALESIYPNLIVAVDTALRTDCYNNFQLEEVRVNPRNVKTRFVGTDPVHPNSIGYGDHADGIVPYIAVPLNRDI